MTARINFVGDHLALMQPLIDYATSVPFAKSFAEQAAPHSRATNRVAEW